jgi:hypothetical protein
MRMPPCRLDSVDRSPLSLCARGFDKSRSCRPNSLGWRPEQIDARFNPGGVHQWSPATATCRLAQHRGWFEWCWLQVARHLRRYEAPSVGILEISDSGIVPRVIEL